MSFELQDASPSFELPGYGVGRLLGSGSSADVWLVEAQKSGRRFALKCFHPRQEQSGGQVEESAEDSVRREIGILSVLDHQHLVKAHDVISLDTGDGSRLGILFDYAAGGSLAQLVAARGRLTVGETVTVLTPMAQVLAYLHAKGFTHSDVAPGNVLFSAEGKPLLADMGIARMVADPAAGTRAGTAGFADPAPVDSVRQGLQPERDLYSLAAVGWFCLTGKVPAATRNRPPLPLIHPEVPPSLAAALESGLNEDRRQRPTAAEFATAVYRSAAPAAVGLSTSVHPSVIPELLTRRRLPDADHDGLRGRVGSWRRSLTRFPADGRERRCRGAGTGLPAGSRQVPVPATPGHRGRRAEPVRPVAAGLGGVLAVGILGTIFWATGNPSDTARPFATPPTATSPSATSPSATSPSPPAAASTSVPTNPGTLRHGGSGSTADARAGSGSGGLGSVQEGAFDRMPAAVEVQLGSADPALAVLGLAWLRSEAFRQGMPDLLDKVNVAGSDAAAADAGTMAILEASGRVLAGFSLQLRDIEVSPGGTDLHTLVGVEASTSSYVEHTREGEPLTERSAVRAQRLQLVLEREDGRWQISGILPG